MQHSITELDKVICHVWLHDWRVSVNY